MGFSSSLYLTRSVPGVSTVAVVSGAKAPAPLLLCIVVGNRKKQLCLRPRLRSCQSRLEDIIFCMQ
jgi:hypothetical protein